MNMNEESRTIVFFYLCFVRSHRVVPSASLMHIYEFSPHPNLLGMKEVYELNISKGFGLCTYYLFCHKFFFCKCSHINFLNSEYLTQSSHVEIMLPRTIYFKRKSYCYDSSKEINFFNV
jgi:hypothetical protein